MKKLIACDVCSVTGAPDEMHSGYDGDDYCTPHWRERELRELKRRMEWLKGAIRKDLRDLKMALAETKPSARPMPEDGEKVALEYCDIFAGGPEVLIARRELHNWVDVRSGKTLREKAGTMYSVRWWPLNDQAGIPCSPANALDADEVARCFNVAAPRPDDLVQQ